MSEGGWPTTDAGGNLSTQTPSILTPTESLEGPPITLIFMTATWIPRPHRQLSYSSVCFSGGKGCRLNKLRRETHGAEPEGVMERSSYGGSLLSVHVQHSPSSDGRQYAQFSSIWAAPRGRDWLTVLVTGLQVSWFHVTQSSTVITLLFSVEWPVPALKHTAGYSVWSRAPSQAKTLSSGQRRLAVKEGHAKAGHLGVTGFTALVQLC